MKSAVVCFVLTFFFASPLFSEAPSDVVLIPRDVYVGDIAELSFTLDIGKTDAFPDGTLVLSGESLPASEEVSIKQVTVTRRESGAEVRIIFVPWVTGRVSFPTIPVHESLVRPPDVTIVSILDRSGSMALEPARSPLLIPGTTWMLYGGILAGLLLVVGSWYGFVSVRRWLLMNPDRRIAAKRTRFFARELRLLAKKMKTAGFEWWYAQLSSALKRYLLLYYTGSDTGFLSLTGTELAGFADSGASGEMIRNLFTVIYCVRFSGSEEGVSRSGLLESAGNLSRILEERTDDVVS